MNNGEYKDVWRVMSEYKFQCPVTNISDSLSCIICHTLMIDACQSVCGCRFCHRCIVTYLDNGHRYCPGGKPECIDEYLVMERDVARIARMNDKISRLPVGCPNKLCHSTVELREMEAHLRLCEKQVMSCPYSAIGCCYGEHSRDQTVTHVTEAALTHTELMIQRIKEMEDSVEKTKSAMSSFKKKSIMTNKINKTILGQFSVQMKEIQSVKECSKFKENQVKELIGQVGTLKRELQCLKKDGADKRSRIESLEEEVGRLRDDRDGGQSRVRKVKERRIGVIEMTKDHDANERESEETEIFDWKKEVRVKAESTCGGSGEGRMTNWINLCFNKDIDYVWKINDLTMKKDSMRKERIFSESFYSSKYKLCLCLYIDDGDRISLCCYIMKGDHDQALQWPMRRAVTFNIIDQCTLDVYKTETCTYDTYGYECSFERPVKDINDYGIGLWPFIDYAAIVGRESIVVNDSLVITCVLTDQ